MAKSSKDKTNKMKNLKDKAGVVFAASGEIAGAADGSFAQHDAKVYVKGSVFKLALAIILSTIGLFQPLYSFAQDQSTVRDGQHDFDFTIGTWKTHIRRLLHPLTSSND